MNSSSDSDGKIRALWESVWSDPTHARSALVPDRYAVEAYRQMRPFFDLRPERILEVGCGTGRFCRMLAEEFPASTICGVDVSEKSVALARNATAGLAPTNLSFAQASTFSLPFSENTFDIVFSQGVIALFTRTSNLSDITALREMLRVTKPGGCVLVSAPNWWCVPHTFYKWWLKRNGIPYEYGYEKSYTRRELAALLGVCGLINLRFSGFFPSYGFHRLSKRVRHFSWPLRMMGRLVDRCDAAWISHVFGFEHIAVGMKPREETAIP